VLCVGTLIVVAGWGAELGIVRLRNAVFNAVDVSYEPPPSPPTTTGARASTNMPAPGICDLPVPAARCLYLVGWLCRL
jgi:hypothetical protein